MAWGKGAGDRVAGLAGRGGVCVGFAVLGGVAWVLGVVGLGLGWAGWVDWFGWAGWSCAGWAGLLGWAGLAMLARMSWAGWAGQVRLAGFAFILSPFVWLLFL